jgi:hypothetical protein
MNHLYIEPVSGLANRMRVIASVLEFKKQFECEIYCVWGEDRGLNAKFNELFENIDGLNIIPKSKNMKKLKSPFRTNSIFRLLAKVYNKFLGFDYYIPAQEGQNLLRTKKNTLYDIIKNNNGNMYIQSNMIDDKWENAHLKSIFRPVRVIMEKVESIHSMFSQYSEVVGLHIRRTDNLKSIAYSPIELFINEIENKIKSHDNIGFFLATDDTDIEYLLLKLYSDKIIIVEQKSNTRDSLEGIQDAVVDMFSLSKTSMIYGSYWSSFSLMSGKIGSVECVSLKKSE